MEYDRFLQIKASWSICNVQQNLIKKATDSYVCKWSFIGVVTDMGVNGWKFG
jgi:hypothetical protein